MKYVGNGAPNHLRIKLSASLTESVCENSAANSVNTSS